MHHLDQRQKLLQNNVKDAVDQSKGVDFMLEDGGGKVN